MKYQKRRLIPYFIICLLVGYIYFSRGGFETSTVVVYDTIKVIKPLPFKVEFDHYETVFTDAKIPSIEVKTNVERVKVVNHTVYVPIHKYNFDVNGIKIYASGYNVAIDSVVSVEKTTFVQKIKYKKRKFSLGITGGYGFGLFDKQLIDGSVHKRIGFIPTITIGLTYSFF